MLAIANHPALLDHLAEAFAELELTSRELAKLRTAVLDAYAHGALERAAIVLELDAAGLAPLLERARAALLPGDWWVGDEADPADVGLAWRHAAALHNKVRALHRELREAEQEFGREFTDTNFRRIVEIQRQLSTAEGSEASIDGFGGASGRAVRPM
ncbi:hypothetical protein ACIKTA_01680 [Hansschlegelia beijingensis]